MNGVEFYFLNSIIYFIPFIFLPFFKNIFIHDIPEIENQIQPTKYCSNGQINGATETIIKVFKPNVIKEEEHHQTR